VPYCEDPSIGGGAVLAFSEEEAKKLKEEIQYLQSFAKEFLNNAEKGREKIAALLLGLNPEKPEPDDAMHDIKASEMITEIWDVKAGQSKFVRAKSLKKFKSKKKIDIKKIKQDASLWTTQTEKYKTKKGKTKKREVKVLDREKIKSMLTPKLKQTLYEFGKTSGGFEHLLGESVNKWIDKQNDSLKGGSGETTGIPENKINYDYKHGAQLMRYYSSGVVETEFDLTEFKVNAKAEGKAQIALAEGHASTTYYVPNREGWHAKIMVKDTILDFGYFRAQLTLEATGMLGASIVGAAQVGINYDDSKKRMVISDMSIPDDRKIKGKNNTRPDTIAPGAQLSVKAFAGVEVGGKATGAGLWGNPETIGEKDQYKELLAIGAGLNGGIGIGGNLDFYIAFHKGKLKFKGKAALVIGYGGGGEIAGSIGFGAIYEFIQFVYHQLNNNNFSYLDFMDEDAFHLHIGMTLMVIETAGDAYNWTSGKLQDAFFYYDNKKDNQLKGEDLAKRILSKPDILRFTSPEAKGALLYTLSHTDGLFWPFGSNEERQEEAILEVLSWCQTVKEFKKTLRRIHPQGLQTHERDNRAWRQGVDRLMSILDWNDETAFKMAILFPKRFIDHNHSKHSPEKVLGRFPELPIVMEPIQKRIQFAYTVKT